MRPAKPIKPSLDQLTPMCCELVCAPPQIIVELLTYGTSEYD